MTAGDALVAAARFELTQREQQYPTLVANRRLTADEATIDFQAWHAVVGFLETDRFQTIDRGGIDGQTEVGWALAEAAVLRAGRQTGEALKAARAAAQPDTAKIAGLDQRRDALRAIARLVGRRKADVEAINAAFRERRRAAQPAGQPDSEEFRRRHGKKAA